MQEGLQTNLVKANRLLEAFDKGILDRPEETPGYISPGQIEVAKGIVVRAFETAGIDAENDEKLQGRLEKIVRSHIASIRVAEAFGC